MIEKPIRSRDKSKKRNMIIDGAIRAYMELGYKNVSMDIIAEYASVSKKTVYNHFESKENVILTIISEYLQGKSEVKNMGELLRLTYDNSSVSPVLYNGQKYNVDKVMIVSPSIHMFNGSLADAEMIIQHIE